MEKVMLAIKAIEFLLIEFSVLAVFGAVLAAGLYQIVRDKVSESRRCDQVAPKAA